MPHRNHRRAGPPKAENSLNPGGTHGTATHAGLWPLLSREIQDNLPGMGALAVFPEVNPLPGAQSQAAVGKRYDLRRACQRHFDMAWHIVGPLHGMDKMRIVLRNQLLEKTLEIGPRCRVGIFHDHKAATGMTAKYGHRALTKAAFAQLLSYLTGNLIGSLALRADLQNTLVNGHRPKITTLRPRIYNNGIGIVSLSDPIEYALDSSCLMVEN